MPTVRNASSHARCEMRGAIEDCDWLIFSLVNARCVVRDIQQQGSQGKSATNCELSLASNALYAPYMVFVHDTIPVPGRIRLNINWILDGCSFGDIF